MGAVDIVKQSIKYPFENKKVWLIIGVLFLLGVILEELTEFFEGNLLYHAFKIIYFIGSLFVSGYEVSVVHHGVKGLDDTPDFTFKEQIIDGFKSTMFYFIYFFFPLIIGVVVAYLLGVFSNAHKASVLLSSSPVLQHMIDNGAFLISSNYAKIAMIVPHGILINLAIGIIVTVIIAFIAFLVFTLFALIGHIVGEEHGFKKGFNIKFVSKKLKNIGWSLILSWYIMMIILIVVLLIIRSLVQMIPEVGPYLAALIITSYLFMMTFRSVGLVYHEEETDIDE
ncbi:MAG: DUF4013 domain-containing protein [Methanobacteriaceae archaeon]|nr:DUF4013 domain-containing protein [Methanobacteriaceae archaeon]